MTKGKKKNEEDLLWKPSLALVDPLYRQLGGGKVKENGKGCLQLPYSTSSELIREANPGNPGSIQAYGCAELENE